jgi:hypothetical protein
LTQGSPRKRGVDFCFASVPLPQQWLLGDVVSKDFYHNIKTEKMAVANSRQKKSTKCRSTNWRVTPGSHAFVACACGRMQGCQMVYIVSNKKNTIFVYFWSRWNEKLRYTYFTSIRYIWVLLRPFSIFCSDFVNVCSHFPSIFCSDLAYVMAI